MRLKKRRPFCELIYGTRLYFIAKYSQKKMKHMRDRGIIQHVSILSSHPQSINVSHSSINSVRFRSFVFVIPLLVDLIDIVFFCLESGTISQRFICKWFVRFLFITSMAVVIVLSCSLVLNVVHLFVPYKSLHSIHIVYLGASSSFR